MNLAADLCMRIHEDQKIHTKKALDQSDFNTAGSALILIDMHTMILSFYIQEAKTGFVHLISHEILIFNILFTQVRSRFPELAKQMSYFYTLVWNMQIV